MKHERFNLTDDGRVYIDSYLLNSSREIEFSENRPAVVVCPGGGYEFLSEREAEPIAMAFAAQGFHTFVLYYSICEHAAFPNSLVDLSRALKLIRDNSDEWGVRSDSIAVCGFSAGGHLAASLGVHWKSETVQRLAGCNNDENKPNALVLCYPLITSGEKTHQGCVNVITGMIADEEQRKETVELCSLEKHVGSHTPPSYIMHTYFDSVVPVENSLLFANALARENVPFEMHILQNGVHGLALGNDVTMSGQHTIEPDFEPWIKYCSSWLKRLFECEAPDPVKWESARRKKREL